MNYSDVVSSFAVFFIAYTPVCSASIYIYTAYRCIWYNLYIYISCTSMPIAPSNHSIPPPCVHCSSRSSSSGIVESSQSTFDPSIANPIPHPTKNPFLIIALLCRLFTITPIVLSLSPYDAYPS